MSPYKTLAGVRASPFPGPGLGGSSDLRRRRPRFPLGAFFCWIIENEVPRDPSAD